MNSEKILTVLLLTGTIVLSAAKPLDLGENNWRGAEKQMLPNGMNVYQFTGKNHISFTYKNLPGSFTFTAWVKPDSAALKGSPFMTKVGFHTQIGIHRDGRFFFHAWNEFKKPLFVFGSKAEAGKWYFIAGAYSRKTGTMTLYVDGKKAGEQKIREDLLKTTDQFSLAASHSKNPFYSGLLAGVHIFGEALTPGEIQKLAQNKPDL